MNASLLGSNWHRLPPIGGGVQIDPFSAGSQTGAIIMVIAMLVVVVAMAAALIFYWWSDR